MVVCDGGVYVYVCMGVCMHAFPKACIYSNNTVHSVNTPQHTPTTYRLQHTMVYTSSTCCGQCNPPLPPLPLPPPTASSTPSSRSSSSTLQSPSSDVALSPTTSDALLRATPPSQVCTTHAPPTSPTTSTYNNYLPCSLPTYQPADHRRWPPWCTRCSGYVLTSNSSLRHGALVR